MTRSPRSRRISAVASPMPDADPVMTTVRMTTPSGLGPDAIEGPRLHARKQRAGGLRTFDPALGGSPLPVGRAAGRAGLVPAQVLPPRARRRGGRGGHPTPHPAARAWTSTLPSAWPRRARRSPADRSVGGELHSRAFREPPPTMWTTSAGCPESSTAGADGPPVGERRGCPGCSGSPGRGLGTGWPVAAAERRRSGPACRRAAGTPGRRRRSRSATPARRAAAASSVGRSTAPGPARSACDSCSSHRPMTLRR